MGLSGGVGIKVEGTYAGWVVSELVRKGPAHLNGKIHVGDLIVSVDKTTIKGSSSALAPLMIGLPGSEVEIGVKRGPGGQMIRVKLTRAGAAPELPARSHSSLAGASSSLEGGSSFHQQSSSLPSWQHSLDSTDNDSSGVLSPHAYRGSFGSTSRPRTSDQAEPVSAYNIRPGTSSTVEGGVRPSFAYDLGLEYSLKESGNVLTETRRARSVALLPGMNRGRGSTPEKAQTWILDIKDNGGAASRRPSISSTYSSRPRSASEILRMVIPPVSFNPGGTSRDEQTLKLGVAQAVRELKSGGDQIGGEFETGAGKMDQEAERQKTLAMIMRTPEGKMWKAERRREREEAEAELRARLAVDAVTGDVGGGKFNNSNSKSELDWIIHDAKTKPASNAYNPQKGGRGMGGKFSESKRELSLVPRGQKDIPGPCSYKPDPHVLWTSRVVSMGNGHRQTAIDALMYLAKDIPGPGEYDVRKPFAPSPDPVPDKPKPRPRAAHDTRLPDNASVPGPGSYPVFGVCHRGGLATVTGGVIAETNPPSFIDLELRRAEQLPGPTDYNIHADQGMAGGRFSKSVVLSNIDVLCREAAKLPGPGQYRPKNGKSKLGFAKSTAEGSATSLAAKDSAKVPGPGQYGVPGPSMSDGVRGGKMSEARPASDVDILMKTAAAIPGPGAYGLPKDPRRDNKRGAKIGPAPVGMSPARIVAEIAARGPGPGAYGHPVPDPMGVPGTETGWKAQETYYPFMRYRAR